MTSGLSGWPAIRTIARREIRERGRDRSTLIGTLITVVILAGIVVIPTLVGAGDDPKAKVLAVTLGWGGLNVAAILADRKAR